LESDERDHENLDDSHGDVLADVIPGRILRDEFLRRIAGDPDPAAQGLALRGHVRDHGAISVFHVDLRATQEVVLTPRRSVNRSVEDIDDEERPLAASTPRPGADPRLE